jgi:argininosuccinate lyase
LGQRIHFGRSRNDLIATTLRLFVHDSLETVISGLSQVISALSEKAKTTLDIITPGMTHLQSGQPIRVGHILAAHAWALIRDLENLKTTQKKSTRHLPLGSAAFAGTTLSIDLDELARGLGFESAPVNSYDAVGDRDFIIEALQNFSLLGIHLSRLAEDLVIWSSTAFGLVKLPSAWSTGSSIMPNKRNPDVPELIRAKSSHLIGACAEGHVLLKGLATSYASDLHELKGIYLRALDEVNSCFTVLPGFIGDMEYNRESAKQLLSKGHLLATDIANHLTLSGGMPFREAYRQTALLVHTAQEQGVALEELKPEIVKELAPDLQLEFLKTLSFESAVEARTAAGGTSRKQVLLGIKQLDESLKKLGAV